ncbi:MAG: hypothetical protein FWG87_07055 [Defluviitaleaceae bacterium]|nr:hypothetical protein [Defluviitaleaceae bacterium]
MKKMGLLFLVVILFLLAACNTGDEVVSVDGTTPSGESGTVTATGERVPFAWIEELNASVGYEVASANFEKELAQRVETSPLHIFNTIGKALEHGTTKINVVVDAERPDWYGEGVTRSTNGANITIQADVENSNLLLNADIVSDNEPINFMAFLNKNGMGIGSDLIGGNYGVNFATLVPDALRLMEEAMAGDEVSVDFADVEALVDIFKQAGERMMYATADDDEYVRLLADFNKKYGKSEETELIRGDQAVKATRIYTDMPMNEAVKIYRDLFEIFERDPLVDAFFANPLIAMAGENAREEFMSGIRSALDEMESELSAVGASAAQVSYYVGENDRLLRMEQAMDMDIYGEAVKIVMALDMGDSATDTWTLEIDAETPDGSFYATIDWTIREENGNHIHGFSVAAGDGGWFNFSAEIAIYWNPQSGDFVVMLGRDNELLKGSFTANGTEARLYFDFMFSDEWVGDFDTRVEITTSPAVSIPNVDYVNILGLSIGELEEMFMSIAMANMAYEYDNDWSSSIDSDFDWESFDWENFDWENFDWEGLEE